MKTINILPNEMFDDGSIECMNFCVVGEGDNEYRIYQDYEEFKADYGQYIPSILQAIDKGNSYLPVERDGEYFEIQWG